MDDPSLRQWFQPSSSSSHITLTEAEPKYVYSWLLKEQYDDCLDSDGLWAHKDRINHFPIAKTEEECLISAFNALRDKYHAVPELIIISIEVAKAKEASFQLLSGTHGKKSKKRPFYWLCKSYDDNDRMLLPFWCYRSYDARQSSCCQQQPDNESW